MWLLLAVLGFITAIPIMAGFLPNAPLAYAQEVITVPETSPCFLNYSAGTDMLENCGYGEDYLQAALAPWQWITGGYFSMILVSILVLFSYIKYHKAVYPLLVGMLFLPIAYFVFPDEFLNIAFILVGELFMILLIYIFIRQTKEYDG